MSDPITPRELATELGVDARRIREFLRSRHGKRSEAFQTRWQLDESQAAEVREHFRRN